MSRTRTSVLDYLKTSRNFYDRIYSKAYSNFIEDSSIYNAMMLVVSCHALCEWLVAENKTTWEDLLNNCAELKIIKSLSNHFKHKEETRNPTPPIRLTIANEPCYTPDGDCQFGSYIVYSDLQTKFGFNNGENDLELMFETADRVLCDILFDIPN